MELARWILGKTGLDAADDLRGDLSDYAAGSRNLMPSGLKQSRPFLGLTLIGAGARLMFQMKNTWGGLDDDGATPGKGSLFSSVADMLVYIGQGQVKLENNNIVGAIASNVLRLLLKWNNSYTDVNSGPFAAGLPEPSAPAVGIVTSSIYGAPNLSGTVSIKYARLRSTTGGRSRASATSLVLVLQDKAIYAVVPAIVSGQTYHIFFGTDTKLGGIGLHYRIARANPFTNDEYRETDVERTITITSITGTDKLNSAAGFTAGDIGKLVENVSGFTFAAGTTIAEVISTSQVRLSAAISSGTSGSAKFVAYAGNIRRSVVLNWTPSDLVEETAWIYDFPPPTGSHAFQLENRMFVCSYADATGRATATSQVPDTSASSANPGTALIASIPNHFESYDPRYPIFLPEEVVDILSDGMESYKFIGGKNGIYAAQYLNVTNAAPLTLSVLLRGEGIAHPGNWCARERAIYLYTGKGQPVRIIEGGTIDKTFGAKVRQIMRNWTLAATHVTGHPNGGGVVYSNGREAYFYDEVTERWSTSLALNDEFSGNIVSSVSTQSRMLITLETGGVRSAYYFDEGTGSDIAGVGHYLDTPGPQLQKYIQRLRMSGVSDRIDKTIYLGIHANTIKTHINDGSMVIGTNVLASVSSTFTNEFLGLYVLVRKAGPGGDVLFARVTEIISPTQIRLGPPVADLAESFGGGGLSAAATISGAYVLFAFRIFPVKLNRTGTFEINSEEMFLPGFTSYAVSMYAPTLGINTQPLDFALDGMVNEEAGWALPSAKFNMTV